MHKNTRPARKIRKEMKRKATTETGKHNREIYIFPYGKIFFLLKAKEKETKFNELLHKFI